MKSIKDTFETIRGIISALPVKVDMAVVGGYAVILHGVERTGRDKKLARLLAPPRKKFEKFPRSFFKPCWDTRLCKSE
jgi:hypothetical protein